MPVISVKSDNLFKALGKKYTEEEFETLCFDFGIELDDVVEEEGHEVYKIDLPANRHDLLCLEGLSRALKIFGGKESQPLYTLTSPNPAPRNKITVGKNAVKIRPFVVGAILRDVVFDADRYDSFIALQDQLHRNIARKRTLVAIGTHDLDSMSLPASYDGEPPKEIEFVHLFSENDKKMNGKEMMDFFKTDVSAKHIKEYVDIIYESEVYPCIRDSNQDVLSLPPIINGKMSKITLDTKNVFIECTATDLTKANVVLNIVVSCFSEYCANKFTIEPVLIEYPDLEFYKKRNLSRVVTPNLSSWEMEVDLEELRSTIGLPVSDDIIESLCSRMQLPAKLGPKDSGKVKITIPCTRSDIMHPVDVIEDVAIAYGYNKVSERSRIPPGGAGGELRVSALTDILRHEMSRQGYTELMTFGLCSTTENFLNLGQKQGHHPVILGNPKTIDFQQVRLALAPGALKTLAENKNLSFSQGMRLFEVSDVVYSLNNQAFNSRHLVCLYAGNTAGVEHVHGMFDRIMQALGVVPLESYASNLRNEEYIQKQLRYETNWGEYEIREGTEDAFFPGMRGDIWVRRAKENDWKRIGCLGALHPDVLQKFKLTLPVSLLELDVQVFV